MKKTFSITFIFALLLSLPLSAQLRADLSNYYDYTGPVVNTKAQTVQNGLSNFFRNNVTMSHSYSMNFGSYGGTYQNVNAYTNTLNFMFSPQLTGRLDVSFLHSPFGGSNMINDNSNLGGEILIRNAELNYKISDNAHISLQYQQLPSNYGYYNPYRIGNYGFYNSFRPWY